MQDCITNSRPAYNPYNFFSKGHWEHGSTSQPSLGMKTGCSYDAGRIHRRAWSMDEARTALAKGVLPQVSGQRKNNKRDKPLAVKMEGEEIYVCCHHCGWHSGAGFKRDDSVSRRQEAGHDIALRLAYMVHMSASHSLIKGGEVVNNKHRRLNEKNFFQDVVGKSVSGITMSSQTRRWRTILIITEGECDAL